MEDLQTGVEVVEEAALQTEQTQIAEVETGVETEPEAGVDEKAPDANTAWEKRLAAIKEKTAKETREQLESEYSAKVQEARDAVIADQGYEWQGKPIKTEAEYQQALKEKAVMDQYQDKDLSDEELQQILADRRFREQNEPKLTKMEQQAQIQADYEAWLTAYPDAKAEDIPQSVWDEVDKGKSLVDAFTKYENQTLKQKLAEVEQAKQIEQQNQENAASSTGSLTGKAGEKPAFFTRDQVKGMTQGDVDKNWNAIMESQKKW